MSYINNPTKPSCFLTILVNPIMASTAKGGEMIIAAQPLANPSSLVMNVLALFIFATLASWVEGKIRLFCLCILLVFTLALGGCIPQPSAALEALRSFQGSF